VKFPHPCAPSPAIGGAHLRLEDQVDAMTALLHQCQHQFRLVKFGIQNQRRWNELVDVMLGQKRLHHFRRERFFRIGRRVVDVRRKVRAIAKMTTAAHHRQIHAGTAALHDDGDDVDIRIVAGFHALLMQNA
jgi:hypothetical protein